MKIIITNDYCNKGPATSCMADKQCGIKSLALVSGVLGAARSQDPGLGWILLPPVGTLEAHTSSTILSSK